MSTNLLFFGIYPYVALLICLVGSWARFDLSQYTWKAGSSQMLSKKGMRVYSNCSTSACCSSSPATSSAC